MPLVGLQCVIVVFPGNTHLLFNYSLAFKKLPNSMLVSMYCLYTEYHLSLNFHILLTDFNTSQVTSFIFGKQTSKKTYLEAWRERTHSFSL